MKMRIIFPLIFLFWTFSLTAFADNEGKPDANSPAPCHTVSLAGTHVSCYGGNNGSVTLSISGGSGNFTINWSTGAVGGMSLTNLTAGYYDVQVVDNITGCVAFDIFNVTQPLQLTSSTTQIDVKCFGQSTASIDLSVAGGTPGYSYNWGSGITTQDRTNIAAGSYSVTITDSKGCKDTSDVTILQPAQALSRSTSNDDPTCFGFSNGWVDLSVWGGTTPYTYIWTNGAATQDISALTAGSYTVTVTDANNCISTASVNLTDPPQLTLAVTSTDNNCFGEVLGTVDVTVSGGTTPYSYSWANSNYLLSWTEEDLDSLENNSYFVTITDAKGCTLNDSVIVSSPTALNLTLTSTDVTAFGGSNGSANSTMSGGVPPYLYSWSNGATTSNLTSIPAGWYVLTVADDHGCIVVDSVYISEPSDPLTVVASGTNATCFGGTNGTAMADASGGTAPYSFLWSNGSISSSIDGLSAGSYIVTLTDAFGNTAMDTIDILQPDEFVFVPVVTNVSCYGLGNGGIDMTITGGTAPYTYEWLNSQFVLAALTEDISGKPADMYMLEIIDTMGCKASYSVGITQPDLLELTLEHTNAYCAFSSTGTASATVVGGTTPYIYDWSNGETIDDIATLFAGTYILTVTDNHGCFVIDSVLITEPDSIAIQFATTPVTCRDQHDGTISTYPLGGNGNYEWLWDTGDTDPSLDELTSGIYYLTVTDMMGCTGAAEIEVGLIEIDCINIPTSFTPNGDGMNDVWVIRNSPLYIDADYQIFNRWGQIVFSQKGTYESWDGTWNGNPIPAETYYYFIKLTPASETLQGTVTIVR
jgi:gliding motility-associated-like protein